MRPPPVATDDTPQTRSKKAEVVDEFDLRASRTATATAKTTSQVAKGKGKQKERSG
ncbi:hypothetical protein BDV93DRAFT_529460 [Ceratobasidium sp. AG-I]|nr:hypothetical protein BDV93DRAFT_529460 [Ceratobasidium sp. AG-I]